MKTFTLNRLSNDFYLDHPYNLFPEIEQKKDRPYIVLLIKIENYNFALPLRTNIKHNYCYKFSKTGRETLSATGVDFTKAVVIDKLNYIGEETSIDDKEYLELSKKYYFIIGKFKKYLDGYIDYMKNGGNEFVVKKYQFCTLKYFNKQLGLWFYKRLEKIFSKKATKY